MFFGVLIIILIFGYKNYLKCQLFDAIENTDIKKVEKTLKMGANINCTEHWEHALQEVCWHNHTPLTLACKIGKQEMVEVINEVIKEMEKSDR